METAQEKKEEKREQKAFSIVKRAKSFTHAARGIRVHIATTHNAWIQITLGIIGIALGFYFHISETEWLALVLATGLLIAAEAFNTAREIDIDLTSPNYHPYARDVKDVAAGAVLLTALTALAIGLIIFLPKIFI